MNQNLQKIMASHFPTDTEGNIHASPEIIQEYTQAIIQECIDNLEWHGHMEAASQLEYYRTNRFGL